MSNPVDLQELAVAGLSNLTTLDPELSIHETGRHVEMAVAGHLAGGFESPASGSVQGWAAVTADAISLARSVSPELADDNFNTVYKVVFDGMLGKLDRFSRYSAPDRRAKTVRRARGSAGSASELPPRATAFESRRS